MGPLSGGPGSSATLEYDSDYSYLDIGGASSFIVEGTLTLGGTLESEGPAAIAGYLYGTLIVGYGGTINNSGGAIENYGLLINVGTINNLSYCDFYNEAGGELQNYGYIYNAWVFVNAGVFINAPTPASSTTPICKTRRPAGSKTSERFGTGARFPAAPMPMAMR